MQSIVIEPGYIQSDIVLKLPGVVLFVCEFVFDWLTELHRSF